MVLPAFYPYKGKMLLFITDFNHCVNHNKQNENVSNTGPAQKGIHLFYYYFKLTFIFKFSVYFRIVVLFLLLLFIFLSFY